MQAFRLSDHTCKNWCWRMKQFYTKIGLQYLEVIHMPIMPSAVINVVNFTLSELFVTRCIPDDLWS